MGPWKFVLSESSAILFQGGIAMFHCCLNLNHQFLCTNTLSQPHMHILCGRVAQSQQVGDDMSVYVSCRDAQDLTNGDMEAFPSAELLNFPWTTLIALTMQLQVLESPKFFLTTMYLVIKEVESDTHPNVSNFNLHMLALPFEKPRSWMLLVCGSQTTAAPQVWRVWYSWMGSRNCWMTTS